jgi:hypothetical protein
MTVVRIDRMPTRAALDGVHDEAIWQENPDSEYAPEFIKLREDLKPIIIT